MRWGVQPIRCFVSKGAVTARLSLSTSSDECGAGFGRALFFRRDMAA